MKAHHDYKVTFKSTYDWLVAHEPDVCIMEQTEGFGMPFSADEPETPKERQGRAYGIWHGWAEGLKT